jgi:hypothetical protein
MLEGLTSPVNIFSHEFRSVKVVAGIRRYYARCCGTLNRVYPRLPSNAPYFNNKGRTAQPILTF